MGNHKYVTEKHFFSTPFPREPNELLYINSKAQNRNDNFELKFFLPKFKRIFKKQKDIIIILNGFAEYNYHTYQREENSICSYLASKHGIASVLLPIPFHFNRFNRNDYDKKEDRKSVV